MQQGLTEKLFMTKNITLSKSDIIFFKGQSKLYQSTILKNFIHFLNSNKVKKPYKFSHIGREGALIPTLSIRENIHLDSVPNQLSTSKGMHLAELLKKTGNVHLLEMFNFIPELDLFPKEVSEQSRKIAALIKGMVQESDYLFLETPELYLKEEHLHIFLNAIHYQSQNLGQIVFVHSSNETLWKHHISKIVSRGDQNQFLVTPVINHANHSFNLLEGPSLKAPAENDSLLISDEHKKIA